MYLFLLISLLAAHASCATTTQIAAAAKIAAASEEDHDVIFKQAGLAAIDAFDVSWPAGCAIDVERLAGGALVTSDGTGYVFHDWRAWEHRAPDRLTVVPERLQAGRIGPLPPAPTAWRGHKLLASDSVISGEWRISAWTDSEKGSVIARFLPGAVPVPMARLPGRVIDLSYLPVPDAPGGTLTVVERLGSGAYRVAAFYWSEAGLRAPAK